MINAPGFPSEVRLKIGMSNLQEGGGALFEGLALEFGNPEFGHHVVNKGPLRSHHATRLKHGHDSRDPAAVNHGARTV